MFLLLSLSPEGVIVGAIVTDQPFSLIGDVGGDLRDPVQDREQGKVLIGGSGSDKFSGYFVCRPRIGKKITVPFLG